MDISDPQVINTLFPFHFFLSPDLKITSKGPSLKKLLPDDDSFEESLDVIRPGIGLTLDFDSIASFSSQIFILRLKKGKPGIPLKGQFVVCPQKKFLLFCGSPWLVSDTSFRESGLMISDFAIHDSLIDLLHHFKAQQMAMEDIKQLNVQLLEKNNLLEKFNRDFELKTTHGDIPVGTSKQSSYDTFLQQYQDLQLKVTQFSAVELQLNNIRARLDNELEMYKRLQRFSSKALKLDTKRAFVDSLAEAVVDVFETEGSVVLLEQFGENTFSILKFEGLGFNDIPEERLQQCVKTISLKFNDSGTPILSATNLGEFPSFANIHEALWHSFQDDALGIRLHVAGLVSKEKSGLYNPLQERHATIFTVFVQKAFALLANLHRALMIRRQLESEQEAMDEMKKLNNQLVEYNQELEKLNRDLDQFVYSASHDLRAPVLAISGIVEEILDPQTEEETKKQDLNRIQKVVDRLDNTISEIVSYSKNARLPILPEKIDLESMISELFDSLRYLKHFDISLFVDLKKDCDLWNDRSRIQSLLKNLLSNAIKFSVERPEGSWIRVSGKVDAESCFLEIADNGEGIAEEYQKSVFDMFYRATSTSHGTGLGLYICNEIMKKIGGAITLKSEAGKGTSICLNFPNQISNG